MKTIRLTLLALLCAAAAHATLPPSATDSNELDTTVNNFFWKTTSHVNATTVAQTVILNLTSVSVSQSTADLSNDALAAADWDLRLAFEPATASATIDFTSLPGGLILLID